MVESDNIYKYDNSNMQLLHFIDRNEYKFNLKKYEDKKKEINIDNEDNNDNEDIEEDEHIEEDKLKKELNNSENNNDIIDKIQINWLCSSCNLVKPQYSGLFFDDMICVRCAQINFK